MHSINVEGLARQGKITDATPAARNEEVESQLAISTVTTNNSTTDASADNPATKRVRGREADASATEFISTFLSNFTTDLTAATTITADEKELEISMKREAIEASKQQADAFKAQADYYRFLMMKEQQK